MAAVTINGLAQNGFPTSKTFIGCYVSPSEKHRTSSVSGPEPQYHDTLKCNVGEGDHTLSIEVINEEPEHPGLIGSGHLPLNSVFEAGRFEDWVALSTSTGAPLGYVYMRLNFTPSKPKEKLEKENPYRLPPPPPPYSQPTQSTGRELAEERKVDVAEPYNSVPHSPVPGITPQTSVQYNSPNFISHNNGLLPPVYTPPGQSAPIPAPSHVGAPVPITAPTPSSGQPVEPPKKKGVPGWMKYGSAALAGAAAVGLGSWVKNAFEADEGGARKY